MTGLNYSVSSGPLNADVRRHMRLIATTSALVILATPCAADEWRLAEVAEIVAGWDGATHASVENQILADFDGNGFSDAARIMRSRETGRLELHVLMNDGTEQQRLLYQNPMDGLGMELISPGTYPTMCGKGYDCPDGGPPTMTLEDPAIGLFKPGSASWVIYWDRPSASFQSFGTSD